MCGEVGETVKGVIPSLKKEIGRDDAKEQKLANHPINQEPKNRESYCPIQVKRRN